MHLIVLHGTAASGKLTTARALERLVGYPVFHNHLIVDALTTVFPFGSDAFVRLREDFWLEVFASAAQVQRSMIFTFMPEATVRPGFMHRVSESVKGRGGSVHFVRLVVSEQEQERRIENAERRHFHKLADLNALHRMRNEGSGAAEQPPVDISIDTDRSSADQSARTIVAAFRLIREPPTERYPES